MEKAGRIECRVLGGCESFEMGITGLLGLVAPAMKDAHLEQFRGKVVAVDAMCWSDAFREIDWIGCIAEATAACGNCPWGWKPLGCCFA